MRWRIIEKLSIVATLAALVAACGPAQQVRSDGQAVSLSAGPFELDGNATSDGGEDWATLYGGGGSKLAFAFVSDITSDKIFTGGGSKDPIDIDQWQWTSGSPPDKDDITHAYAAGYLVGGKLIIYFGLDLLAPNGDAQAAFWFFQNPVGLNANGTFNGVHTIGDVLVLSNFVRGGSRPEVKVYRWVGSGGSEGSLDLLLDVKDSDCSSPGGLACATLNTSPASSPWPYQAKSAKADPNVFPPTTFFEGAINIGDLIPDSGCFSGFLAETRSSQSTTAVLKDFALGNFNLCSISVEKTANRTCSQPGNEVEYKVVITNTGSVTLYKEAITDTLHGDLTSECGPSLAPGDKCEITYPHSVPAGTDALVNTVTARYFGKSDKSGAPIEGSDSASVKVVSPKYTVNKTCTAEGLVPPGGTATFKITFANEGDTDLVFSSNECGTFTVAAGDTHVCDSIDVPAPFTLLTGQSVSNTDNGSVSLAEEACGSLSDGTYTASASCNLANLNPSFTVQKVCASEPVSVQGPATFTVSFKNTGDADLVFDSAECGVFPLAAGAEHVCSHSTAGPFTAGGTVENSDSGTVTLASSYGLEYSEAYQTLVAVCTVENPGEGCSPGYWKTHDWPAAYDPGASFNATFGLTPAQSGYDDELTLLEALNLGGGSGNNGANLARQGIAALLNIAAGLHYPYADADQLKSDIRNGYLNGDFSLATILQGYNSTCPW